MLPLQAADAPAAITPMPTRTGDHEHRRPTVRALEVQRVTDPEDGIVLVDRLGLSEPAFVPAGLLPIVGRCDGTRSLAEIRREASEQVGEPVSADLVRDVVRQLDERHLLLGSRFAAAVARAATAFRNRGVRPPRHAGSPGCPAEPAALARALAAIVHEQRAPGSGQPLRGVVAPHIDLARGAAGYAAAYGALLAAPPADLYVVLGTGHAGPSAPVTGLELDWETPLGTVATDRDYVAAVHAEIGAPGPADVLLHRDEHSIEFQVLFLQHLCARSGTRRAPQVAAFLCGALPSADGDPFAEPWCLQLLAAFRKAERGSGKRVCYVAGADLAHIGPQFGDAALVDGPRLQALERTERRFLEHLQRGRPGAFHAAIHAAGNGDRVCSAPAIALCAELAGGEGELLHYGQALAADGSQAVSFCAMAFGG
jgi:hypothetical protein